MIRTFVSASVKGFLYGRQHPDEMVAIIRKFSQAVDPTIARREAELSSGYMGNSQFGRQAARLDVRQGLGGNCRGAQAVRRRH